MARPSDIIERIREIILSAGIDASPENYELCHRFVTRSDKNVAKLFDEALAKGEPLRADTFQQIRDAAGPPHGQVDVARQMQILDEQIAVMLKAVAAATGDAAQYSSSLADGARDLDALSLGSEAKAVIANLVAQTRSMAQRTASLEASLASASAELSTVRGDLEKARRESDTDALTSLPNRRSFLGRLNQAVAAAAASHKPLALAFCDFDNFKKFNDEWGHSLGDEALRYVASQLGKHFEAPAVPARFGGEEFVVLLPQHDGGQAMESVQRFCETLSARVLKVRSDGREVGRITVSVGVATLQPGESPQALVERADEAMYAAKQAGRNRVMLAPAKSAEAVLAK
jgi:diguanylate cyclase